MILIAGIDEAGRGPLAGPVVAASVILKPEAAINGLMDSKKLSAKKREQLFSIICDNSLAFGIASASVAEIDKINILQATFLAMQRAVAKLKVEPDEVLIDGNQCPDLAYPTKAIIKGDNKVAAISAASILAKVTRDNYLLKLDNKYPKYGFAKHKGYPTKDHLIALKKYGPCPEHRISYKPVREVAELFC
jgi:ribonuclease HII